LRLCPYFRGDVDVVGSCDDETVLSTAAVMTLVRSCR
jgi:hypothetical protein